MLMRPHWLLKGCPHCGGDLLLDEGDPKGSYDCLQCARPHYPHGRPPAMLLLVENRRKRREARPPVYRPIAARPY